MLHGQSLIPSHEQAPADASAALSPEEVGGGQCVGDSSVRVGEREASAAHGLSAGTRVYVCVCVCVCVGSYMFRCQNSRVDVIVCSHVYTYMSAWCNRSACHTLTWIFA